MKKKITVRTLILFMLLLFSAQAGDPTSKPEASFELKSIEEEFIHITTSLPDLIETPSELRPLDVIAVPHDHDAALFRKHLYGYIESYYKNVDSSLWPVIVAIEQPEGALAYKPLPYPSVDSIRFVAEPAVDFYSLYDLNCVCIFNKKQEIIQAYLDEISQHREIFESMLIVRNALYRFYQANRQLPEHLDTLIEPFPHNYLSLLPDFNHSIASKSQLSSKSNLIYRPELFNKQAPWHSIKKVLPYPNLSESIIDMQPLEIKINQSNFWLTLESGDHVIRSYPVALGKNQLTPIGTYSAAMRVSQPLSQSKVYGTRAITLSDPDYAIHGTNDPSSIGKDVTLGCIRMYNNDIEELFSLVSMGTPIHIVNEEIPKVRVKRPDNPLNIQARPNETSRKIYHWRS